MLIGHPFSLFWHCLLSLTAPLWPPYDATYCVNHTTWCDEITSARTWHYYRPLIILVIGLRRSTQAPYFTAPFMSPMTLLGFMCPGPGILIRSRALSHCAINRPHDMSLFSHSLSPDQLPLLCTSFSFASYNMVYGARTAMPAPTIAFVLISPVHTDKGGDEQNTPYLTYLTLCPCLMLMLTLHPALTPHPMLAPCTMLTLAPHLSLHSPICSHL